MEAIVVVVVVVTIINSPYTFSPPLRVTKKARVSLIKAIEPPTATIMPPSLVPIDIPTPFADDDDDDDHGADARNDALGLIDLLPCPVVPTIANPDLKKPPAASQEDPNPSADRLVVDDATGNSFIVPGVIDGGSSIADITLFLRQTHTLFTDLSFVNRVRSLKFTRTEHLNTTQRHMHRIFECLQCHPQLKFLTDTIPDPEALDKMVPRLYLLVRGVPTDARMEILNSVMCFFGESLYLKTYDDVDLSLLPPEEHAKVRNRLITTVYWELLTNYFFSLFVTTTTGRISTWYLKNVP